MTGLIYTADIAVDDISFSKNLTCVSVGKSTPPENFEGAFAGPARGFGYTISWVFLLRYSVFFCQNVGIKYFFPEF